MSGTPVQTKHDVQAILNAAGLRPDKRFGQNFLIDGNLMRKLVASAGIAAHDSVLEVGGGTGGLSDVLAAAAHHLLVVEIDHRLVPLLRERFRDAAHVTVLETDVLDRKHAIAPAVAAALAAAAPVSGGAYKLVANLPYSVATPLLMNLLTAVPRIDRFCFTIQKEVADRITARPHTKDYGPLAIAVQTTCAIQRLAKLPPQAFWPAPKVESTMLRLDRKAHPFEAGDALTRFIELLHAAFAHRRKTLRYNLGKHLDESSIAAAGEVVDLSERAEALDLETWIALGQTLGR